MPRQPTTHAYNIARLNLVFLLASALLLVVLLAMMADDYDREWKHVQREYNELDKEKTIAAIEAERNKISEAEAAGLQEAVDQAQSELEAQGDQYDDAVAALEEKRAEDYAFDQTLKFLNAEIGVYKYDCELEKPGTCEMKEATAEKLREVSLEYEDFRQDFEAKEAAVKKFTAKLQAAQKAYDKAYSIITRLEDRLPRFDDTLLVNKVRDSPMLDFMDPRVRIKEILLLDLFEDVNMGVTVKRDRCMTCHKGIDTSSWAEDKQPFTTHPRLAEFVGSDSPHPADKFGCTVCHSGRGYGTTFQRAAHWPSDLATEHRWEEEHDWHEMHHWDYDQLPKQYMDSSCYQCHAGQIQIPGADKWNRGIRLMELNGCFGCHKVQGYEKARKAGPGLAKIASKTTPDFAYAWIRDPKGYRPRTRMPQLFDLENIDSPHNRELTTVAINAMVSYLFQNSEEWEAAQSIPVEGDADSGLALIDAVGCLGCHRVGIDENASTDQLSPRNRGPNLVNLGSKLSAEWLFAWLKDPHAYYADSYMPNLRLTDQEAADITAYLLTQRDKEWEKRMDSRPTSPPAARRELMMEYLRTTVTKGAAEAKLASMSTEEQDIFLGQKMIARNGCYGCHSIPGFEDAQRIGTELTEEGSKDVLKFDFGLIPSHPDGGHEKHAYVGNYEDRDVITYVPKTRHDWILTKLLRPRIWDQGKERLYDEKLKMPWYDFSFEDAEAITTAVLSFQRSLIPHGRKYHMSAERQAVERGRTLVWQYNCRACHEVENAGRAIGETIEDTGMWPPILNGQGEKVQTDWFFEFLKKPVPIRPWLAVRMPTFGFADAEANAIVEYFARLDEEPFPSVYYDADAPTHEELAIGKEMFSLLQCQQCHVSGGIPEGVDPVSLAPDLTMAHARLKPEWVIKWVLDPGSMVEDTKMPMFWDPEEPVSDFEWFNEDRDRQIRAIRDHLFVGMAKKGRAAVAAE